MSVLNHNCMCVTLYKLSKIKPFQLSFCSSIPQHVTKKNRGNVVNVAVIGAPNSGKSTLINKILERKICAASNKVHTTTKMIRAICYASDTQIVFLDTPGIVTTKEQKKYKLPDAMLAACEKSLRCADVVGVVHDISNRWTKDTLHSNLKDMLHMVQDVPSFLILNKIDQLKSKKELLAIIRKLTNGVIAGNSVPSSSRNIKSLSQGYSNFSDVFLVSALNGDGVKDIKEYLISNAKPAVLQYSPEQWTDQSPELLIEETVRAKFLDFLAQEIPYRLKTQLEYYQEVEDQDKLICSLTVECPSERLMTLISGAGGGRLEQIRSHVRNDLIDMFKKTVVVDIKLQVKCNKSTD